MASTYLTRTLGTPTNSDICTISVWLKRASTNATHGIGQQYSNSTNNFRLRLLSDGRLQIFQETLGASEISFLTTQVFRDTSAWYHIVIAFDTTQGTASNRVKLYVNGSQISDFDAETYPPQNTDIRYNINSLVQEIGKQDTSNYFDGSMAHVHFIDGTAYDADTFGETDATTGIWKPKTAPSVTYGTNGFFLKFENSGAMGTDSSGNSNNFTVNGTMTQTIDTPSNVFSTLNPLSKSNATLTNGNTTGALTSNTDRFIPASTLKVSQGKWYAEFKLNSLTDHTGVGITGDEGKASNNNNAIGKETNSYAYVSTDGNFYDADSGSAYGSTYTSNDIIGIALDLDNNYIYFSKNGTWQNSGDPTSGATGTGGKAITDPASVPDGVYAMGVGSHSTGGVCSWSANFGNGYFGTTQVSSANSDTAGIGEFEYEVPDGYYSLCTKNINLQEYD